MLLHILSFSLGAVGGYFVPALVKKWLASTDKFVQDVEKKL